LFGGAADDGMLDTRKPSRRDEDDVGAYFARCFRDFLGRVAQARDVAPPKASATFAGETLQRTLSVFAGLLIEHQKRVGAVL
jgi:hypothetical protein